MDFWELVFDVRVVAVEGTRWVMLFGGMGWVGLVLAGV